MVTTIVDIYFIFSEPPIEVLQEIHMYVREKKKRRQQERRKERKKRKRQNCNELQLLGEMYIHVFKWHIIIIVIIIIFMNNKAWLK